MRKNFISAILVFSFFTLLFGVVYPLTTTFISNQIFPEKSQGSLIKKDDKILGSQLIGQNFSDPKYLWGRLSATSPNPYNAAASSGSNLDLSNPQLMQNVKERIALLKQFDPDNFPLENCNDSIKKIKACHKNNNPIPVDLVTSSASGLDPEISVDAASYQVKRIAKFRNIPEEKVQGIITKHTKGKQFGLFGEKRVNFLLVNLELDEKI